MSVKLSPKDKILELISKSTDKHLGGPKSIWRSKVIMENITFSDVVDIVLYYISLQPDMRKISLMESYKFYELLKKTMEQWVKTDKKAWGYKYYKPDYDPDQKHKQFFIDEVALYAWYNGPGPVGGTMGPAEHYAYLIAGFLQHKNLLLLFSYPEELMKDGETGNWPSYRKHVVETTFPKWRRKIHAKRLESVFHLAEMICTEMRNNKK